MSTLFRGFRFRKEPPHLEDGRGLDLVLVDPNSNG